MVEIGHPVETPFECGQLGHVNPVPFLFSEITAAFVVGGGRDVREDAVEFVVCKVVFNLEVFFDLLHDCCDSLRSPPSHVVVVLHAGFLMSLGHSVVFFSGERTWAADMDVLSNGPNRIVEFLSVELVADVKSLIQTSKDLQDGSFDLEVKASKETVVVVHERGVHGCVIRGMDILSPDGGKFWSFWEGLGMGSWIGGMLLM